MPRRVVLPAAVVLAIAGLVAAAAPVAPPVPADPSGVSEKKPLPPVAAEPAPPASPRLADLPEAATLGARIEGWFEEHGARRGYVQVDKPIYKPGETIWFRAWDLAARELDTMKGAPGVLVQLVNPRGSVELQKQVESKNGVAANDFELPDSIVGGEYTLKAIAGGNTFERAVIVSTYEPPRLKKKLEFLRKAYGEGDEVTASIDVKRPTGEALAKKVITAAIRLDGADLPRVSLTTDEQGSGIVRFVLPAKIERGDGLLTVLVEDGGVTESISKSIPIIVRKLQFAFFPEGGKLVSGLPSRLYFEAKTPLAKPADAEGRIVDELGNAVATFATYKNGLGRVEFTPATGRRYHAEITKPAGVSEQYALPIAETDGCVLRTFDDADGQERPIRAAIRCSEDRRVVLSAMLRERPIDAAVVKVAAGKPTIVYLQGKDTVMSAQGVARLTLFDERLAPIAERVVFRNRRAGIRIGVKTDRPTYAPRDTVSLALTASDAGGRPIQGDFAISVVDDTVVSMADDKTSHLFSKLFLDPEMPRKVEEPNFYFDLTEDTSAVAMELLMGTWGYTSFAWKELEKIPADPKVRADLREKARLRAEAEALRQRQEEEMTRKREKMAQLNIPRAMAGGMDMEMDLAPRALEDQPKVLPPPKPAPAPPRVPPADPAGMKQIRMPGLLDDQRLVRLPKEELGPRGNLEKKRDLRLAGDVMGFAPVRVFPIPKVTASLEGPRTDFRETIFWTPSLKTGADGKASVKFPLSDAVTSFRVFTEGTGGGFAGRDETVFKSSLPFSLGVKLPVEVSAGDRILMPLMLSNERASTLDVTVQAEFGKGVKQSDPVKSGGALAAGARTSSWYALDVTGTSGDTDVRLRASTGSLSDELVRQIHITPVGFPQLFSKSGTAKGRVKHELDLGKAVPGSALGTLTLYPSPVATMVSGLEGMLRQPGGCFEQTSSTNYPNVMIMQYLKEQNVNDPALIEKSTKLLDDGYRRLSGFESPRKGYEWFGGDPGHEALTAYGVVEFADMKRVFGGVDDGMVTRTTAWLKTRRDGNGGYLRDPKALDSFGGAAPEVTNAYITWSLALVGTPGIEKELDSQQKASTETTDAYRLALATHALLVTKPYRSAGVVAAKKLAAMQDADGSWKKADHSITRSTGQNLHIETTSLAVLALLEAGGYDTQIRNAIVWLDGHRGGFGEWGATQATVLALKAMTAYANASRKTKSAGKITVFVNGKKAGEGAWAAGRRDPVVVKNFGEYLTAGVNVIELEQNGEDGLPYSLAVEYRSAVPASSPDAVVGLTATLEKNTVKAGESVRLNAVVTNRTDKGQPMTLARIGIPGGLSFQPWQLKDLREKGLVAFWETRAREVILYFRDLKPTETKTIPIDLVATVPGTYTGPASSAYLYYSDDLKTWAPETRIEITR